MQRVISWKLASILLVACQSPSSPLEALTSDFTWTQAADCPQPRFEAMGLGVNGQLLVMGGFVSESLAVTSRVDVFDPDSNVWSQRQDLPGAETHAAAVAKDGTVYVAAGFRGPIETWVTSSEFWAYDFANDVWNALPSLPAPRSALSLTNVGNTFFAIGGLAADGDSDSPENTYWSIDDGQWTAAPDLPNPRNHLGGAAVQGQVYIVGGRHSWDETGGNQSALHQFDPNSSRWTTLTDIPQGRSEIAASTFSTGDRLVVIGGSVKGARPSSDVWVYDPGTDQWAALPPLPGPRKGAVADVIGNRIVVTTGSPTGTDPAGTTWIGCCLD
jgi:N-acetylneuraminic acid mutarotase